MGNFYAFKGLFLRSFIGTEWGFIFGLLNFQIFVSGAWYS